MKAMLASTAEGGSGRRAVGLAAEREGDGAGPRLTAALGLEARVVARGGTLGELLLLGRREAAGGAAGLVVGLLGVEVPGREGGGAGWDARRQ